MIAWLTVLLGLAAPAPAASPARAHPLPLVGDPELARALGPVDPKPGSWAEYLVREKGQPAHRVRASLVSPLRKDGAFWLELHVIDRGEPPSAVRLLLRRGEDGRDSIVRAFVAIVGQAPVELPLDALPPSSASKARALRRGPMRKVDTPQGVVECSEVQIEGRGTLCRNPKVPVWGLVRAQMASQDLSLADFGTSGARSLFPDGFGDGAGRD